MSLNEVFQMFQEHQANSHHMSEEELQQSSAHLAEAVNCLCPCDQDKIAEMMCGGSFKAACFTCEGGCADLH
jgi:hypothetical protein